MSLDDDTETVELGTSGESIDTPEELKERQRLNDIMTARREARTSFQEQTDMTLKRLYELARSGHSTVTKPQADALAARNVYRKVSIYIEELSYHLQTTDLGQYYWSEAPVGIFTPTLPAGCNPLGDGPDAVEVVGLSAYLDLDAELEYTYSTYEDGGRYGDGDFPEEKTVEMAVPTTLSQSAFRATNHFVEELLGLELDNDQTTVYNLSLGSDGGQANTR